MIHPACLGCARQAIYHDGKRWWCADCWLRNRGDGARDAPAEPTERRSDGFTVLTVGVGQLHPLGGQV